MANTPSIPLSELLRSKSVTSGDDEPKKKSREDWRKAKELEEARKAGTAPAAVDEEGKDINPHIPQYIATAPWYFGSAGPTLKHQRVQEEKQKEFSKIDEWYKRGVDQTFKPKKYRPGACENCGAMTHKKKDCMERPRKVGAASLGVQLAPDEYVQPNLSLDFDGKRDRWAGYDPSMHQAIIDEFHKVEEAKRKLRADKLNTSDGQADADDKDDEDEEDEDKYVDDFDMPGTKVDSKQRITVRNLRIREDTAKYLRNLDPNSAYYDPKTRSMRDNPHANAEDTDFAGENYVRFTGDTVRHAQSQKFAWEAYDKGVDVHILAEPTKLEMLQKVYEEKKEEFKSNVRESVVEKYGGAEHLQVPPKELLLAQTEAYVEYSRSGKIIKGADRTIVKSKYEEDVHPNNHTSVFGSYWHAGQWGYKCCHSSIKNSYCTGEAGRVATATAGIKSPKLEEKTSLTANERQEEDSDRETENKNSEETSNSETSLDSDIDEKLAKEIQKKLKKKKLKKKLKKELKKQRKSEKKISFENQLKKALRKEEENQVEGEILLNTDERKRKYNSMYTVKAPTDAEMEAYYMKRHREDDPMAQFLTSNKKQN